MRLIARKWLVIGIITLIVSAAHAVAIAAWLDRVGVVEGAAWLREEFLTGTALAVIAALLLLLTGGSDRWLRRRCDVCGRSTPSGRYCVSCGSRQT